MNDRTPNGLILPDVATLAELFATQRELPIVMPAVPGGVRFEARSCSALFVTDPAHQVAELYDASVVVVASPITTASSLIAILEAAAQAARPILIAAPAIDGEALGFLLVNRLRGLLEACAVTADASTLAAIARLARCEVAGSVEGTGDLLGKARRVVASTNETILVPAG